MLKLYSKTIVICLRLSVFAFIASIFFEIVVKVPFVVNYAVGIACSSLVVLVTTILQFKSEQTKLEDDLVAAVRKLLTNMSIALACLHDKNYKMPSEHIEQLFSEINECISIPSQLVKELCWFSRERAEKCKKIWNVVEPMERKFLNLSQSSHYEAVKQISTYEVFFPLIDATLEFIKEGQGVRLLEMLRKGVKEMQASEENEVK